MIFTRPYFENLCNPKRYITARLNHKATRTPLRTKKGKAVDFSTAVDSWSGQRDSNPRPSPWQGDALPAEPCPHIKLSNLEATPGFEPGVKALQASALPLGHVAILASCLLKSWSRNRPAHLRQWSGQRDSNPRPSPWQGDALPAEPCPHY